VELHRYVDELQAHLAEIHDQISATYFSVALPAFAQAQAQG
jgi:hypothetical protein